MDEQNDYIFRFHLGELEEKPAVYADRVTEMIRSQLESLLDVVILFEKGRKLEPDSFSFLNDREATYRIFRSQTLDGSLKEEVLGTDSR